MLRLPPRTQAPLLEASGAAEPDLSGACGRDVQGREQEAVDCPDTADQARIHEKYAVNGTPINALDALRSQLKEEQQRGKRQLYEANENPYLDHYAYSMFFRWMMVTMIVVMGKINP